MKRDMELIRKILLAVEEHEHGFAPDVLKIEGYDEDAIGYHQYLICDAGLADGIDDRTLASVSPTCQITMLTSAGHDFLDAARSKTIWAQAKEAIDPIGGASIQVWTAVLTDLVKRNLGLSGE